MIEGDPNVQSVEFVAAALAGLCDELHSQRVAAVMKRISAIAALATSAAP